MAEGLAVWAYSPQRGWSLERPRVLGILNLTPDSFSDGGRIVSAKAAAEVARRMAMDGADGVDVGGESTRPGAVAVAEREQVRRVVPAIRAIRAELGARFAITIDTTRSGVAAAALDAGADAINDVSAGMDDAGMFALAAERGVGIVLMHRLVPPSGDVYSDQYKTGQTKGQHHSRRDGGKSVKPPKYRDVVHDVGEFLARRAIEAMSAGVRQGRIVIDPGLGFGKTVEQNLELIRRGGELVELGYPMMSGVSRKSFVARAGSMWGLASAQQSKGEVAPIDQRLGGTIGLSVLHALAGARIMRVHDVRECVQAMRCVWGVAGEIAKSR